MGLSLQMGLGSKLHPKEGMKLTCNEMLAFLKRHIPEAKASGSNSSRSASGLQQQVATIPLAADEGPVYKQILGDKCAIFKMST